MTLNPDFRQADDVQTPENLRDLTGWTDGTDSERDAIYKEKSAFADLQSDLPVAFRQRAPREPLPQMLAQWELFQKARGRYEGSADWTLLDEFVTDGKQLNWLPQLIGSCVVSNTFRAYVIRQQYEIVMLGQTEEYFGRDERGPNNWAWYGPQTYGCARKRGNMRGGDGLYCAAMTESLAKDGVLLCSTPALQTFLDSRLLGGATDYPEPQGNDGMRLYREFGNWQHIDSFRQYMDFPVLESPEVTNGEQLWDLLLAGKPAYVCSMEAIHKVGVHPDGFAIHARNPRDQWAHNMSFHGALVASDGERFVRESNESWGADTIYNRRFSEVDQSFRAGRLTCQAIGEIAGPSSSPPSIA